MSYLFKICFPVQDMFNTIRKGYSPTTGVDKKSWDKKPYNLFEPIIKERIKLALWKEEQDLVKKMNPFLRTMVTISNGVTRMGTRAPEEGVSDPKNSVIKIQKNELSDDDEITFEGVVNRLVKDHAPRNVTVKAIQGTAVSVFAISAVAAVWRYRFS